MGYQLSIAVKVGVTISDDVRFAHNTVNTYSVTVRYPTLSSVVLQISDG